MRFFDFFDFLDFLDFFDGFEDLKWLERLERFELSKEVLQELSNGRGLELPASGEGPLPTPRTQIFPLGRYRLPASRRYL